MRFVSIPYTFQVPVAAGPDAYYTNGPASIYQSPGFGGFGVITPDADVASARLVIRWTAPADQTIYIDGLSWEFKFNIGNGRKEDFYVRKNKGPFLVSGTTGDSTVNDGSGVTPRTQ